MSSSTTTSTTTTSSSTTAPTVTFVPDLKEVDSSNFTLGSNVTELLVTTGLVAKTPKVVVLNDRQLMDGLARFVDRQLGHLVGHVTSNQELIAIAVSLFGSLVSFISCCVSSASRRRGQKNHLLLVAISDEVARLSRPIVMNRDITSISNDNFQLPPPPSISGGDFDYGSVVTGTTAVP